MVTRARSLVDSKSARLDTLVRLLRSVYGEPTRPPAENAFQYYLWDRVGYLFDDAKRLTAFRELQREIGLRPDQIASAPLSDLARIAAIGGIEPQKRASHMREAADWVTDQWGGDLDAVLKKPLEDARHLLKQLPMIAEAGADRIILFSKRHPVLGLESNGVRVLQRIGYGTGGKSFSTVYRSVRDDATRNQPMDSAQLIDAHLLLRQHGHEICRASVPMCDHCVLRNSCVTGRSRLPR
jgi:endonuclease III